MRHSGTFFNKPVIKVFLHNIKKLHNTIIDVILNNFELKKLNFK